MTFSPEFTESLDCRTAITMGMNAVYITFTGAAGYLIFKARHIWVSIIGLFLTPCLAIYTAGYIYNEWWMHTYNVATAEADKLWIANHDGGNLIVGFEIFFKGFVSFLILGFVIWRTGKLTTATASDATEPVD